MLFSRNQKVLNKRLPGVVEALASLEGDFVLDGELVALDPKGGLPFSFFQTTSRGRCRSISTPSTCSTATGNRCCTCRSNAGATCWEGCFPSPRIRCGSLRYCRRHRGKFSRLCASSAWKGCSPRPKIRCASQRYCERLQDKFLRQCASSVWKGVIGNRIGSTYEPGERSGAWIKLRANLEQEFVIGGDIPEHAASMRCSSAFTRRNGSSFRPR